MARQLHATSSRFLQLSRWIQEQCVAFQSLTCESGQSVQRPRPFIFRHLHAASVVSLQLSFHNQAHMSPPWKTRFFESGHGVQGPAGFNARHLQANSL